MTQSEHRMDDSNRPKRVECDGPQIGEYEIGHPSPERMRAANEVGSAIAHQLNGPLTALRLYIGELRENCGRLNDATQVPSDMQQMLEAAFQETEHVCAMMKLITDAFEQPLYPKTAPALGRNVISWWLRRNGGDGDGAGEAVPVAHLTRRERQVLGHVSQGCSNKQGAIRMDIRPRTFESHRARLMRKLGARNTADLVRMALSENRETS